MGMDPWENVSRGQGCISMSSLGPFLLTKTENFESQSNVYDVFVIVSSQAVVVLWCYKNICRCCYCKSILEVKTNPPITEHRKG